MLRERLTYVLLQAASIAALGLFAVYIDTHGGQLPSLMLNAENVDGLLELLLAGALTTIVSAMARGRAKEIWARVRFFDRQRQADVREGKPSAELADRALSWVGVLVPRRLRIEDIGDAREVIHALETSGASKWLIYTKVTTTLMFVGLNVFREVMGAVFGRPQAALRRLQLTDRKPRPSLRRRVIASRQETHDQRKNSTTPGTSRG